MLRDALGIAEATGRRTPLTAAILGNLGVIHARRGDHERAQALYEHAVTVAAEVDPGGPQEAWALGNLGGMLRDKGEAVQALGLLERAVELTQRHAPDSSRLATLLWSLALSYVLVNDLSEASRYLTVAEAITQKMAPESEIHSRVLSAKASIASRRGEHDFAVVLLQSAVTILETHGSSLDLLDRQVELASALYRTGRVDAALVEANRAEQTAEAVRVRAGSGPARARVFAHAARAHDLAIALLLHPGEASDNVAALEALERRKARGLADELASVAWLKATADPEARKLAAERLEVQRALQSAHFAQVQPKDAPLSPDEIRMAAINMRERAEQLDQELAKRVPAPEPPADLGDMAALVGPGEAMIQVAVLEGQIAVWTVTQHGYSVHSAPLTFAQLMALYFRVMDPVRAGEDPHEGALQGLARVLLSGLPPDVGDVRVISDGPLHWFPVELLPDPHRDGPIGVRRRVTYAPSATVLRSIRVGWQPPSAGWHCDLVALGDPAYKVEQFSGNDASMRLQRFAGVELPGTGREVDQIARLYDRVDVRVGTHATETAVRMGAPAARVVHLACHGVVDDDEPLFGGLVLAYPTGEDLIADPYADDLLAVWEIANLDLSAEVVVLSACSTGRGPIMRGEGIVGMVGATLAAGARSAIVSLWPVDDDATATFMGALHVHLSGGARADEALRRARENVWKSMPAPRHWASWVFHGWPGH